MRAILLREVALFFGLLVALAVLMHGATLVVRLEMLANEPSIFTHALLWTLLFYSAIWLPRASWIFFKKIRAKKGADS